MEGIIYSPKSFRYEILNPESSSSKVLYVLHGYGNLAKFFIRKFEVLKNSFLIVAPEGMHRYYLNGSNGRVGASWMTSEDRLNDISDNIVFLNALHKELTNRFSAIREAHLLGFSQGGATAMRWSHLGKVEFKSIVMWACIFPPDMTEIINKDLQHTYFVIGDRDEYFPEDKMETVLSDYINSDYEIRKFHGGHEIHSATLSQLYADISQYKR